MMPEPSHVERIRLVFAAACVGDAMGAATEAMHPNEIRTLFGGPVTDLRAAPPRAPFALGLAPGRLTDDATQMIAMVRTIIATKGFPTLGEVAAGLVAWASDDDVFQRFAGPTTRLAVERLRAGVPPAQVASPETYSCVFGTTNGGAMRAPAAGCARPGDPDAAVSLACLLAAPTHNTQIALGGAGAVAACVAAGLGPGSKSSMIDIALQGAAAGEAHAEQNGRIVGGAGVRRRIELAAMIGERRRGEMDLAVAELTEVVGNGVAMAEAVPHAIGLVVAAGYDPWEAIVAAVNGGNDSDTIALIAGAIAAAFWRGADPLPPDIVARIETVNNLHIETLAAEMAGACPETFAA